MFKASGTKSLSEFTAYAQDLELAVSRILRCRTH